MNVLMINPVHPSTPHVAGVRAWRFAQELAKRGHRVVLLTVSLDGRTGYDAITVGVGDSDELRVLTCAGAGGDGGAARMTGLLGRAITAVRMFKYGGRMGAWVQQAVRTSIRSREVFAPDIVWCTFGMFESIFAAKRIASAFGCPWVLDVKDNWELYVPWGMRHLMAWRIKGWSAVTSNAQLTADKVTQWQGATASIIYSGVEREFYPTTEDVVGHQLEFRLNLIGSVYMPALLEKFLDGVRIWLDGLSHDERHRVALQYLGSDVDLVAEVASRGSPGIAFDLLGFLPMCDMARHCRAAAANVYIAHSSGFHHKLLELLACARPVIAFPSEHPESLGLANKMGGRLFVAINGEAVARVLTKLYEEWRAPTQDVPRADLAQRYSWPVQTIELERVLTRTVTEWSTTQ